jgi:hypothetical protein
MLKIRMTNRVLSQGRTGDIEHMNALSGSKTLSQQTLPARSMRVWSILNRGCDSVLRWNGRNTLKFAFVRVCACHFRGGIKIFGLRFVIGDRSRAGINRSLPPGFVRFRPLGGGVIGGEGGRFFGFCFPVTGFRLGGIETWH